MMAGLYTVMARGNLIKKLVGLSILQTSVFLLYISMGKVSGGSAPILADGVSVFSNPLPHVLILTAILWMLREFFHLPRLVILRIDLLAEGKRFLMLFFVLLPLAMTMTLLWKIKEAALTGIFEQELDSEPARKNEADSGVDTDFILQAREPSADRD